ncbi:MAG: hypothetical protein V4616_13955 [Bacteroidota bacterium]
MLVLRSSIAQIGAVEDSVFVYRSLTFKAKTDSTRLAANDSVRAFLFRAFQDEKSFDYPFGKLKAFSIINLSDRKTRLITWNVELGDYSQKLYGLVVQKQKGKPVVTELINSEKVTTDWERKTSGASNWLGALYYEAIPAGPKNTFILLGWRGNDRLTSQKVVDVFYFENNEPKFGMPIIQHGKNEKYRAIFTYPADIKFSLEYDRKNKQIVFDRVGPTKPQYAGNYAFYSITSDFDAYKSENNRWILVQDVKPTMPEREIKKPFIAPGVRKP